MHDFIWKVWLSGLKQTLEILQKANVNEYNAAQYYE